MAASTISWTELFAAKESADFTLEVKVLKKAGEPFLILSGPSAVAAQGLSLYPAQTKFAKAAKSTLGAALRSGLPVGLGRATICFSLGDAFPRFLGKLAGAKAGEFPSFAILAGNPRVEGRRFIVLLFDEKRKPTWVVKAGIGEAARRLVQKESSFLQSAPADIPGLPKISQTFSSERITALAQPYVLGNSPRPDAWEEAGKLLASWLGGARRVHAEEIPAWKILEREHGLQPVFRQIEKELSGFEFCPALVHGDFAPWNIKVSPTNRSWTALDWERGELRGFPGWDWFHCVIQTGILVEKLSAEKMMRNLEILFGSAAFQDYAARAGIRGKERVLAIAYLFHYLNVVRPTEGRETAEALLSKLAKQNGF